MRYCSKCGNEILDEAVVCPNCGCKIQKISKKHNNGLGITALVLSIIGFWTGWLGIGVFLDVLAIILGVCAFVKAKKSSANTGLSIAGTIIATVSLLIMLVLFILPSTTSNGNAKATITNNYGQTEYLTADELMDLKESNAVSFDDKYKGAHITIVDVVDSVKGERNLTLRSSFDWDVELAFSQDLMKSLKKGDKVRVDGKIYSAFVDVKICDAVISQEVD